MPRFSATSAREALCAPTIFGYFHANGLKGSGSIRRRTDMAQKPMTKTQLVAALADEMGSDKKTAGAALDAMTAIVTKEVAGGGAVTIPGIGKVYCRERPERMVRNPATGEQIKKEADKQVKVTIAKALKDSVNG